MENTQKVIEAIASVLQKSPDEIHAQDSIENIEGWDSLAHIQIISEIEDRFGVEIPIEEIAQITKVSQLAAYVNKV